jgi:hypothetical protein
VIERAGDLAAILTNLEPGAVLFIDEIHRLQPNVEEILYPAMEDFKLDLVIGQGPSAQTVKIDLPHFTLIGATTRAGLLSSPLRDRFGVIARLNYYPPSDLVDPRAQRTASSASRSRKRGALGSSTRSRGTPRIANRLRRGGCETSPRSAANPRSPASSRAAWRGSRSARPASTAWTGRPARAGREVRRRAGRTGHARRAIGEDREHDRGDLRAVPDSGRAISTARRAGGSRPNAPTSTSA